MSDNKLFKSAALLVPETDTINAAGGNAYLLKNKEALACFAMTNTFGGSFYESGQDQLKVLMNLISCVEDNEFIAKLAVYSRNSGFMKDMPAYLLATLAVRDVELLKKVFFDVVDNAKMLKNFVQIMRSGVTGRKSLGSAPKNLVRKWLRKRTPNQLLNDNVGGSPSMSDVLKMVHAKPVDKNQEAMFGYIVGKKINAQFLPGNLKRLKAFHEGTTDEVPNVAFQLLTGNSLTRDHWVTIAKNASWQMTRMNLNTFLRHGVFTHDQEMVELVAKRLSDKNLVAKSKVMPYQLLAAYKHVSHEMPRLIIDALHDALEYACENVPVLKGKKIVLAIDVSGSMRSPITGYGRDVVSKVKCVDVAGLMGAAILRKNPSAKVIMFHNYVIEAQIEARDSILTNARTMANISGGGTRCDLAMENIATKHWDADLVVFISDNESFRAKRLYSFNDHWLSMKRKNKKAKLVLLDIKPSNNSQTKTDSSTLNISGFSDKVFDVIKDFSVNNNDSNDYWVNKIMNS